MHPMLKIVPPVPIGIMDKRYPAKPNLGDPNGCRTFGIRLSNGQLVRNSSDRPILNYVKDKDISLLTEISGGKCKSGLVQLHDNYPRHPYMSDSVSQQRWIDAIEFLIKRAFLRGTDHWLEADPSWQRNMMLVSSEPPVDVAPVTLDDR